MTGRSAAPGRWWALAVLTAIYTVHSMDRMVITILNEPIKREFGLSDHQIGLLGGLAHGAGYALTVVPLGMLVDRVSRVRLLALLVTLWSGLTAAIGLAASYAAMALCRFGVGAAEGGGSAGSLSLLADYFTPRERGTAIGIFYASTGLGVALIFLTGGMVAEHFGWRAVFYLAGAPGLILGLLALATLQEPSRRQDDGREATMGAPRLGVALRAIGAMPPLWLSILGLTIAIGVSTGFWAWAASFLIRVHGLSISQAGLVLAAVLGVVQSLFLPLFGRLHDRVSRDRPERIHAVSAGAILISIPVGMLVVLAPTAQQSIGAMMLLAICTAGWLGQSFGAIVTLAPVEMRGTAVGLGQLCVNLIGTGCGPLLVGAMSDGYGGGAGLRYAMATLLCLHLAAALTFMLAMQQRRRQSRDIAVGDKPA